MKRRIFLSACIVILMASLPLVGQVVIADQYLSNFEVVNTFECCYDDFELYFYPFICDCIIDWFPGWGTPPVITQVQPWQTCKIQWLSPGDCIPPGASVHFGLVLDYSQEVCYREPECIAAFWSVHGVPVQPIPIPFQNWDIDGNIIYDVMDYPPCCPEGPTEPLLIDRWFAVVDEPPRLSALVWGEFGPFARAGGVDWQEWEMDEILCPGRKSSAIPIEVQPGQAALVAIQVKDGHGELFMTILNALATQQKGD